MQKENLLLKSCDKNNLSSREVVARDLPHPMPLFNEEKQPCFTRDVEDPRQRPSGMTGLFYHGNNGFTLIELLVVVLIIGILAAVALPQYQKAVERARASEALPLLKSVYQAAQAYYMANGEWPTKFDELAVEIPWTGNVKWRSDSSVMRDTRSNDLWSLQIYQETGYGWSVIMGRISGKYKGAGFSVSGNGTLYCKERIADGVTFDGNAGDYCVKIMRCSGSTYSDWNVRSYPYQP